MVREGHYTYHGEHLVMYIVTETLLLEIGLFNSKSLSDVVKVNI